MSFRAHDARSANTLRSRHVLDLERRLPEHDERIGWSADEAQVQRTLALRMLLRSAIARSAWHRSRLSGFDLDSISCAQISELPIMTKSDLMSNFGSIVADRRLSLGRCEEHLERTPGEYLFDEFQVVASGGSSGQRGVFVYGWDEWVSCYASTVRFQVREWNSDPTLAEVPRITAVVAASSPTHISAALSKTFSGGVNARRLFPVSLPMDQIVSGLNELQPTVLMGYSSFLPHLAHEARAGRLRITPRRIVAISEPLLPESRAFIEDVWPVRIANGYGMSEGMFSGFCGHSVHLPDDLCIVEPIGADGQTVGPGEISHRILLTNLYNLTQPLIRYELTDQLAVVDGDCRCGSMFTRIADPQGRLDDVFIYANDLTIHPHVFRTALGTVKAIVEYQVRQTQAGARIAIVSNDPIDTAALGSRICGALVALGLSEAHVDIELVGELPRPPSGKLKRFSPIDRQSGPGYD